MSRGATQKPTTARTLAILLAIATPAVHAGELTEEGAVARALARPALVAATGAAMLAAEAAGQVETWRNPVVAWTHEQTWGGSPGDGEDTVVVSQALDLSGRAGLLREAARHRAAAAALDGDSRARLLAARAREAFWEALAAAELARVTDAQEAAIGRALATARARASAGDLAPLQVARLEGELLRVGVESSVRAARADAARARLAALVGTDAPPSGSLVPDPAPAPDVVLAAIAARPDLRALAMESEAMAIDARLAARWWVPDVEVTAGYKTVEDPLERRHGVVLGVAVSIPLLDTGLAERTLADAGALALGARSSLAVADASAEALGLRVEAERLRDIAVRFRAEAAPRAEALVRMAEAAFTGGELTALELIDAHAGAAADAAHATELALAARLARVRLDRITGTFPAPGGSP